MSTGFEALGLRAPLVAATRAAGFDAPTSIQRAAIPVLRRGGNALITASPGSGVTAAVVLPLLDRLAEPGVERGEPGASPRADGAGGTPNAADTAAGAAPDRAAARPAFVARPRALVITVTDEHAAHVARTAAQLAASTGIGVRAWTMEWSAQPDADLLIAAATPAARAIRESALKLDRLSALVIVALDTILALAGEPVFDDILVSVPHDAQRVVTAALRSGSIDRFVEAHVRRAITIPARPAVPTAVAPVENRGTLTYLVVPHERKPAALARLLRRPRSTVPRVSLRSTASVARMRDELRLRGWRVDGPAPELILVAGDGQALIACDVPFDAHALGQLDLEHGVVMIEAHELPHLRAIAAEAGIALEAAGGQRGPHGAVAAYRAGIRKAITEQDLGAQLALLGPLLDEYAPEEVAAALSALLRKRIEESTSAERVEPQPAAAAPAFVRLYVSIGHRDGARPGDIVGAITGEASIRGDRIGRIEIRDNFSVVEIAADDAEKVIGALNGTTVKGRSVRVDYDRPGTGRAPSARRQRPANSQRDEH